MHRVLRYLPRWLAALITRADQSLQARILVPLTLLSAATLALMAASALSLAHGMNERAAFRAAELFATVAAEGLGRAAKDRGAPAIREVLDALARHEPSHHGELMELSVVDPTGLRVASTHAPLAGTRAWDAPPAVERRTRNSDDAAALTVLEPLGLGPSGQVLTGHWLEVRLPRQGDLAAESALAAALLWTAAPSLLVLLAIAWWLIGREATRPLHRLVDAMRRAGAGDATARADEGLTDELGAVARSFDDTFAALQHSRAQLEAVHRERLERADRLAAVGELAAGLSHEIKNPLAGLSVALEMLAQDHPKETPRGELIAEMQHQVSRLTEIMEGLLGFVRNQPSRQQPVDVNQAVERALRLISRRCRAACSVPPPPQLTQNLPKVHADPSKLEQVFLNLLLNACQAMAGAAGGCRGQLEVRSLCRDGMVLVEIADAGPGISPEVRGKLFKPFFTTKPTGNGLGLAISEQIIVDHGGHIAFTCPPSGGTVFTVALPALPGEARP